MLQKKTSGAVLELDVFDCKSITVSNWSQTGPATNNTMIVNF